MKGDIKMRQANKLLYIYLNQTCNRQRLSRAVFKRCIEAADWPSVLTNHQQAYSFPTATCDKPLKDLDLNLVVLWCLYSIQDIVVVICE